VKKAKTLQPFLKWAGGKSQLLKEISNFMPGEFNNYFEPFVGGGAVLFELHPYQAVINDTNPDLYNCYIVVRDYIEELIADLGRHQNDESYYYKLRDIDLSEEYGLLSPVQRASRTIFLNKTCYNGLYRVNKKGHFNVPFGKYKKPNIVNEHVLRLVSSYLSENKIKILDTDFAEAVEEAASGDFIYFDPPYDPLSDTSSFTAYSSSGFGKDEQKRLRDVFVDLDKKGCKVMLSNSATDFILDLYKNYRVLFVSANRSINSVGTGRGKINEVLVMNYT
jgi:DNA adenine methylase